MQNSRIAVLYVVTKLELGGAQKVCLSLLDGLRVQGHESFLISGAQGFFVDRVLGRPYVHLFDNLICEVCASGMLREVRAFFKLIAHMRRLKKQFPQLIVHTHSSKAGVMGRWAAWCAGVKYRVHTVHGFGFHPFQSHLAWMSIFILEFVTSFITSQFICVSRADAAIGSRCFPFFARRVALVRAAVDDTFFVPAQLVKKDEHDFIFGTVACLKPQKNLFDLVRAFERVYKHNRQVRLEIVGDGQLRTELEEWIAQHQLSSVIKLLGWRTDIDVCMRNWNAFALSSLWEGLPCAVVEARLCKLPVVAYATGGIPEIIDHGHNGLLCQTGDWKGLARYMTQVACDKALCMRLSQVCDEFKNFGYQAMVDQHIDLYKSLLT